MMLVVDASFLLAVLMDELEGDALEKAKLSLKKNQLFAPTLLSLEIGNTLLMHVRRKNIDLAFAQNAMKNYLAMDISYFSQDSVDFLPNIFSFSHQHGLTFYDALYLMLALKLKAQLASFDKKMLGVAKTLGTATA